MPLRRAREVTIVCAALALTASAAAQDVASSPPGVLFTVADTTLHLHCTGAGQPTILLEAGIAGNYLDWTLMQPLLARHRKVCAYDRAGAGFSARTDRPREVAHMTQELRLLTEAAGISAPFVLVGHSFGGLLGLAYAQAWPDDVAGLVLLDPMHPQQFERFPAAGVDLPMEPQLILGRTGGFAALYGLPKALHPLALELAGQDKARVFIVREMRGMAAAAQAVQAQPMPHAPARILLHGDREWDGPYPDGRMENLWTQMQGELAAALGAPAPVALAGAGHQLALDAPEPVAAAIEDFVASLAASHDGVRQDAQSMDK